MSAPTYRSLPAEFRRALGWAAMCMALAACGGNGGGGGSSASGSPAGWGGVYANRVPSYSPFGHSEGQTPFYVRDNILGPPEGTAQVVVSLGDNPSGEGGSITVGFGTAVGSTASCIVDQPGDDFLAVENVFSFSDANGTENYTEAAYVEVYGLDLTQGPYRYAAPFPKVADGPTVLATEVGVPGNYTGLAGISVGGNPFDLNTIIVANGLAANFQACFVRIVDAGSTVPDYDSYGLLMVPDGSGADMDAIQVFHSVLHPGLSQ